ncbi:hypothetical protein L7F22_055704 [Adiantum nelumboides]|nr:hypothetical protein [Adiantum nelumboides]
MVIRLDNGCSEGPRCNFTQSKALKTQRGLFEHPSTSRMVSWFALNVADKSYGLPANSNASRMVIRLADGCSEGPRCNFTQSKALKMQHRFFEHSSTSRLVSRLALDLAGKSYGLLASSNASHMVIRLADGCSEVSRCNFTQYKALKTQRGSFEHPSASRMVSRLALELAGKSYGLPTSSNATHMVIRLTDGCSEGPRCVFSALNYVKLQRGPFEHPSANCITIRIALEFVRKAYELPASSNESRLTIWIADGCSKGPRCVFSALDCVKLQRKTFEHPSVSRIIIRFALELAGKPYDLSASSNTSRLTKRLADGCSKDPHYVFNALNCVKLQCGSSEHPLPSCITIQLALELADKPYDLSTSSNASRLTIRLADGSSKDLHCVFSALYCVKLQRGPSEHPSINRITIRLALELADKAYDLPTSFNAIRLTKRLANGCSKGSRCVFSILNSVKLQRGPSEHPSGSRITIWLALKLVGKPYDLPASSNANRLIIRLADGCSEGLRCVFSALHCVKWQRGPSEHPSASRITIRLALELAGNPYDFSASSNASRLIIRLVDGCSKGPRYIFSALNCVKLQREPFEHPSASRITIRLALEVAGKPYDLPARSNASRLTIRLADGCSKGPRCVFNGLDCVKLQRGPSEHPSASRIIIRLALELVGKPYDLPANSNASRITKGFFDGCSEGLRCIFSALDCVKLQRGPSEHPSASCITIRLALELAGKRYDLSASSNATRLTIRLVDGCSKGPRCIFSALDCVKLQREPSEHPSTSRITIRLALELFDKPYDLPTSSIASPITKRLADGCSKDPRCVFSALHCVKWQRGPSEHPSASRITIRLALELAGNPYDFSTSSNASRLTIRLVDGCSKGPRYVFSALNCVKLQREPFEHTSASRITIRLALEVAGKPYDLPASSNTSRLTIRLADRWSEGPRCVFSALHCVKLQRGHSEHPSASRFTIRLVLELAGNPYDLSVNSNASCFTVRLADACLEDPHCVLSALDCVKLQRGLFEHPSASRITIRLALELAGKPYNLSAISNASRIIKWLADVCSEDPRCVFSALDCVKLQRGPSEHPSTSRITIRLALELVDKPYDLSASFNASRLTTRLADGC